MGSKYQQVSDWVRGQIRDGALKNNDKVESENDLAARFDISRQTARHALDQLVQEGLLFRKKGSGTFVGSQKVQQEKLPMGTSSEMVSIISTYVDGYIFPRILQSMVHRLEEEGYSARISFTGNDLQKERELLESYLARGCTDPLIVEPVMSGLPNPNMKYYREIRKKGIPILFFHSFYPDIDIPYIGMDDVQAGKLATEYLISQGHQNILGIFKNEDGQGARRYRGFLNAMMQHQMDLKLENFIWITNQDTKDFSGISAKLDLRLKDCSAVVCYNDEVAFELTKYAQSRGIRIPEDLSIISIDNSDLARLNMIPLTSVRHPMEELGRKVADGIVSLIQDPTQDITYEFETELVVRDSVMQKV